MKENMISLNEYWLAIAEKARIDEFALIEGERIELSFWELSHNVSNSQLAMCIQSKLNYQKNVTSKIDASRSLDG